MENISKSEIKLQKLGTDYIFYETLNSVLLLAMSQLESSMGIRIEPKAEIPKELINIKSEIKKLFLDLRFLLNSSGEDKENAILDCKNMKEEIKKWYRTIYAYNNMWSAAIEPVYEREVLKDISDLNISITSQSLNQLYSDCLMYIEEGSSNIEKQKRIGKLLNCLPIKITKQNYIDKIKIGLYRIFENATEETIKKIMETYELIFSPNGTKYWNNQFKDLYDTINNHISINPKSLSSSDALEIIENTKFVEEMLSELEDFCQDLLNDLNSIIIALFSNLKFDEIMSFDPRYADIYNKSVELSCRNNTQDIEAFSDTVLDSLEEAIELVSKKCQTLNMEESELCSRLPEDITLLEDTKKILSTKLYIMDTYYESLSDSIFDFNTIGSSIADDSFKSDTINNGINNILKNLSSLPNWLRKIFMNRFMTFLPIVTSPNEAIEIISHGIDSEISPIDKLIIINKIGVILDVELSSHDHHDHECDCHDHDCNCHNH